MNSKISVILSCVLALMMVFAEQPEMKINPMGVVVKAVIGE